MRPEILIRPTALHQRFWDVEQVFADNALLDKVDVVIGGWRFEANRHQVSQLAPRLSRLEVPCGGGKRTRLFENRNADDGRYSHTLTVRGTGAGEGVQYPCPTFAGYLKLREVKLNDSEKFGRKNWEGLFFSYLNLNRSLQAQDLNKTGSGPDARWSVSYPYALAMSEDAKARIMERPLAPADNILDRSVPRTQYAQSKPAERHLRDYLLEIFRKIGSELPSSMQIPTIRQEPTIVFRTLEVCWDFFDEQPILTVMAVKAKMQGISQEIKTRYFPEYRLEEGLKYDSPSVMMGVIDGIAIRCYAKTETTIRLEVVYSQSAFRRVFEKSGILSIGDAISTAAMVKRDAVDRLNVLLGHIHANEGISASDATVDELVENVLSAAPDGRAGVFLLTQLAYKHRLAPYPKDPQYETLRILKRRGVLMNEPRSPRSRAYVVTPRFHRARAELISSSVVLRRVRILRKKRPKR
jgi:hypothetical protein